MPYIIAIVILIIGAVAFTFMQADPAVEPEVSQIEEARPTPITEPTDDVAGAEPTPPSAEAPNPGAVSELVEEPRASDPDLTDFVDGTYTTQVSYFTPRRTEHVMDISLTLENDVVVATEIVWDGDVTPKTPNHTSFDNAYEALVVGQPLNEIYLSRVGGASLTSEAFNEAIQTIETEASAS
jgi:hypothetical protein